MQILQLSTAVPKKEYSTEKLIEIFPCQLPQGVKQNVLNLGVSKRHIVNSVDSPLKCEKILSESGLVELCRKACENAVHKSGLSFNDIGYFIATHDASPFLCPSLSQILTRKLGFNINVRHVNIQGMACAAFAKALQLAENHLAVHPKDYVLLCISGVNSYWFHNQVRGINNVMEISKIKSLKNENKRRIELRKWIATMEFFLFGDGVASLVVAKEGKEIAVKKIVEVTNLGKKDYLAGYVRLAALNEPFKFGFHSYLDKEIPKLGVEYTSHILKNLLEEDMEETMKTARKWAIHTGSEKILNRIAEHYKIPREKIKESHEALGEYGNLAGASLPFILEKIVSKNKFSKGDVILMLGYGWGFSASACLLEFQR